MTLMVLPFRAGLEGFDQRIAFDPSLELADVDEDSPVRCLTPDAPLDPYAAFDFVPHGVFAVARDVGKPLDQHPLAGIAHGVLLVMSAPLGRPTGHGEIVADIHPLENSCGRSRVQVSVGWLR